MDMLKQLQAIMNYSEKNVPYYSRIFREMDIAADRMNDFEEWQKVPFLNKETVQKNQNQLMSEEYNWYPKNEGLQIRRTSGSTGDYLKVCWSRSDDVYSMLSLWRIRRKYYGINPSDRNCSFYSTNYIGNKIIEQKEEEESPRRHYLGFSKVNLTEERLLQCCQKIIEFNPVWMNLQPSTALLLANTMEKYHLKKNPSLKYIELNGELLTQTCRNTLNSVFAVPVCNMYGCMEVGPVAIEIPDVGMSVIENNVYVEIIKEGRNVENQEGEVCITSLCCHAMPFIRYLPGDRGIIQRTPDGKKILSISEGRSIDYAILRNGERVSSHVFAGMVQYTNEYMEGAIKQYQIEQISKDVFYLKLALKPAYSGWGQAVKRAFLDHIEDTRLRQVNWEIDIVDNIYPNPYTGKVKSFIPLRKDEVNDE